MKRFLPTLLAALACAAPALAQGPSGRSKNVVVTLVPETMSVAAGQTLTVALKLEMAPEWHTYWINPGDSGLPTRIQWTLPAGFEAGPIQWPVPERIAVGPITSYGYDGEAWLLSELKVPATAVVGSRVQLAARVDWLECKELCLPGKAQLALELPVAAQATPDPAHAEAFTQARARLPLRTPLWKGEALAGAKAIALSFSEAPGAGAVEQFFPLQLELVDYAAPQEATTAGAGLRVVFSRAANPAALPATLEGVVRTADGRGFLVSVPLREGAADAVAPPKARPEAGSHGAAAGGPSLPVALGFAFVGGLLLNLMPCVLPVLSLKVLSFVKHGGEGGALRHGLAFTAGVLVFFWALAGALLALRAGGEQIGWGFQLQSPPFVAFLASLFLLLALNLFGVFEMGESLSSVGGNAPRSGLAGSFWGGALATLTATPCTAPFMGSALGFALAQPAAVNFAVFTALGAGMAAPYLTLSASPRLLKRMPKPGRWMETFKQLMGFVLLGTVVFLAWLFGRQTGVDGVAALLGALVLVGMAAWAYGRGTAPGAGGRSRLVALASAALLLGAGLALGMTQPQRAADVGSSSATSGGLQWEAWSPERLAELRAAGRPVFVDFTADWCLTCQVNERVALASPEVAARFQAEGVTLLKADWTLRDERITRALAEYGRQGVPVYVLYGRDASRPHRLLPEILDAATILKALDETL